MVLFVKLGDVLILEGDLGVGKMIFMKGFVEGFGIICVVNSLIFIIIKEYNDGLFFFYYMDVYRMEDESEDLGFDEYFYG